MLGNTLLPGGLITWKNCSVLLQHWFLEAIQIVLLTRLAAFSLFSVIICHCVTNQTTGGGKNVVVLYGDPWFIAESWLESWDQQSSLEYNILTTLDLVSWLEHAWSQTVACSVSWFVLIYLESTPGGVLQLQYKSLRPDTVSNLQILFEQDRWDFLVDMFKQDFCKLYGMSLEPLLNIYLQAGLTALKTPYPSHYYLLLFSSLFTAKT